MLLGKKIIVACDGTWRDSDNGFQRSSSWFSSDVKGVLAVPTNVTRICRALKPTHENGQPQLVYYQAGLGSANNIYSFYIGGYLGQGISENIREGYAFICNNYEDGDEIYLIGFSRGAFTARSIGGLIDAMGLLTRKGLEDFYCIFRDWEFMNEKGYYKPEDSRWIKAINIPEPRIDYGRNKQAYVDVLEKEDLTRLKIPIEAIAVWDTVGQLGIPPVVVPPVSWFRSDSTVKAYSFVDTELVPSVRYAYHALALDEHRTPFVPTVWEEPKDKNASQLQELKQCWFPGVHSNIGGSYPDNGIANLTFAWMLQQLSPKLTFDSLYLPGQDQAELLWLKANNQSRDSWSGGMIYDSGDTAQNLLFGASARTPGEYVRTDPVTGKPTSTPLRNTHEYMHASVRVRVSLGGLATADKGKYGDALPLKDWALIPPHGTFTARKDLKAFDEDDLWSKDFESCWKWVKQSPSGKVVWIAEEEVAGVEWDLVEGDSKAYQAISLTS